MAQHADDVPLNPEFSRQSDPQSSGGCLVRIILLGIGLILIVVLIAVGSQWPSISYVNSELKRIKEAGEPLDSQSMTDWYRLRTHDEGSDAWSEIFRRTDPILDGFAGLKRLPILGEGEVPNYFNLADEDWDEEPVVAEFLKYIKPYSDSIAAATYTPTPVWQPIEFKGLHTTLDQLQRVRSIARILRMEFEHALYHRDAPRAFEALRQLKYCADVSPHDYLLISELVHIALTGIYLDSAGKSLRRNLWDAEQLDALFRQVGPQPADLTEQLHNVIVGERAFMLITIDQSKVLDWDTSDGPPIGIMKLPSSRARLLEASREYQKLASGSFPKALQDITDFELKLNSEMDRASFSPGNIAANLLMPEYGSMITAMERMEDIRRMTRTAIAIKQFQRKFGRWPAELKDLEQIGLSTDDWTTLRSGQLGYAVEGTDACVWMYEIGDANRKIPMTVPNPHEKHHESTQMLLIR